MATKSKKFMAKQLDSSDEWLYCTMEEAEARVPSFKEHRAQSKEPLAVFRITQPMK